MKKINRPKRWQPPERLMGPVELGECLEHGDRFGRLCLHLQALGLPTDGVELVQGMVGDIKHCWIEIDGMVFYLTQRNGWQPFVGLPREQYYRTKQWERIERFTFLQFCILTGTTGEFRLWQFERDDPIPYESLWRDFVQNHRRKLDAIAGKE